MYAVLKRTAAALYYRVATSVRAVWMYLGKEAEQWGVRVRAVGRFAWQYRHLQNVSGAET